MKEVIATSSAPGAVGPYSQATKAKGFLFLSGQVALDPATGQVVGEDVRTQTERVLKNLQAVLEAVGSSFSAVVKATVFLSDMGDFAAKNEVYGHFFSNEPPVRSTVGVARLPRDMKVEIDVIAALEK